MKRELIAHNDPKSPVSEVYRTLRTNIQFMNTNRKLKTLLITSTLPGEGKSWVSSNLAVTFAQAGKKVILVDADMRKGRQYSIFGVSPKPGISNYLSGIDENENENENEKNISKYIQETEIENLYVMSAGNIPPNPSELLISPKMVQLVEKLKNISDIVIIDGTPSELVTDSMILARLVDSTVIVAEYGGTKKDNLKRVVNSIKNVGGKIAGVVINKIPVSIRKYKDSYYYGSKSTRNISKKNKKNKRMSAGLNNNGSRIKKQEQVRKKIKTDINNNNENNNNNNENNYMYEKTNDILKELNTYLDNEKKELE